MGLLKIPWVSSRGRWGYERYHGSLAGGGGAMKDTMGLYQGPAGGGAMKDTMGLYQGVVGL